MAVAPRPLGFTGWAQALNRAWVFLYTAGLTIPQKRERRDEIRSDMFEHATLASATGQGSFALEATVASRLFRGIGADIAWRWSAGRQAEVSVAEGASPPLPWLSSIFLVGVISLGAISTTRIFGGTDSEVTSRMLASAGACVMLLGLHLGASRFAGPLLIALGSVAVAWGLWWTPLGPVAAVIVALSGIRRAQRLEHIAANR